MRNFYSTLILFVFFMSCGDKPKAEKNVEKNEGVTTQQVDTVVKEKEVPKKIFKTFDKLADTTFVRLADFSDGFGYELRYATKNNFLKEKVYDCPECYTRVITAKALLKANEDFKKSGVRIKFFDCYRPNSVQYKMWKIVPNPQYVANPKKGSIHNKGGAVDITLESLDGEELDMGTDFDFFGKRAYHDNFDLPKEILENRKLLKETMEKHGFWSTRTEWWHYNLDGAHKYPIANFKWDCN
ncbi:M15 family metallopeptidase [Zobellia nedashkovskayae]|uniref:M15 family metallopeptidase n=1 Tax=Zobellia nedashkovskayae TaxID=2779510 RepID=UPI00188C423F|nr:M15 family metallopeptidase [Zobellia nedashkovskayae]